MMHTNQHVNFLTTMLSKVINEYKSLLEATRRAKPLKIVEILTLSAVPGESKFAIQVTNKKTVLSLSAAEIITQDYCLNKFNDFHAAMIRHAAQGSLIEFLKLADLNPSYKIASKRLDRASQQYQFTVEASGKGMFTRTTAELARDKEILNNMCVEDVYDIGFTRGCESLQ